MSEELINSVQAMLKEETWTRATISNYTINNIKELANLLEKAKSEACTKEINEICTEHHTRIHIRQAAHKEAGTHKPPSHTQRHQPAHNNRLRRLRPRDRCLYSEPECLWP